MRIVCRSTERLAALGLLVLVSQLTAQTPQAPVMSLPSQLQFAHQIGTGAPPTQTFRIYSTPGNIAFTATAATQTGAGWLFVNNGALTYNGNSGTAGQQDVVVTANPTGLPASATPYTGTVTVTSGTTVVSIPISLTVGTQPVLRVNPAAVLGPAIEIGRTVQSPLSITNSGTDPIQYTAQVIAIEPGTGWLTVAPNLNNTGQPSNLVIDGTRIAADRAFVTATVQLNPSNSSGPVTLPVQLPIVAGAQLVISPEVVNFPYQIGFAPPATRPVNVTSTTQTQLAYSATITSSSPWLTLSTTNQTTAGATTVTSVTPNPVYLIPNIAAVGNVAGTYEATVRLEAPATGSVRTLTARLVISSSPQLTLTSESVVFSYSLGGTVPVQQTITVGSTSFPQQFTVTPTYTSGGEWFTVTPQTGTTQTSVTVAVNTTRLSQLAAGTYTGTIRIASASSQIDVPVSLTVSGFALLAIDPVQIAPFEAALGQTPPVRSLIIRSTDASAQPFNITVEYGTGASNWLILSKTSGNTGTTGDLITLNVNPTAVSAAGTYEATMVITPSGTVPGVPAVRIPIRYTVTGSATVTASVDRIQITQVGNTPPTVPAITLSSTTPGLQFLAVGNPPWVRVTPSSGTIPASLTVSFDSTPFIPADYTGSVTISVGNVQTITLPVALRVVAGAGLQGAPSNVTLSAAQGSTTAVTQTLNLTSNGAAINYTAAAASQAGWLSVSPASGSIAATGGAATPVVISANPSGLAAGTYTGTVTLNTPNGSPATTTITVTLTVSAQLQPQNLTIANSATGISRGVSPGLIVMVKGRNMAPPAPGLLGVITNGVLQSTLGEVRVLFDDIPAPLLYVGPAGDGQGDQINAIVPYGVGNRVSTRLVVEYRGMRSAPIELRVVEADPGLFTANQTGSGQAAVLNQNNTANSGTNAAERGQIIQIFATGEGLVTPAGADGRVIGTDIRRPLQPVTVRIGGQPAEVTYAGSAPTLVSGVIQINARVPQNLTVTGTASVPIEVQIGQAVSQTNATVAVR